MITLYQVELCPYCRRVREALEELKLDYKIVNVAASKHNCSDVIEISGQAAVPVLVDDGQVVNDSSRIVAYLREKYAVQADTTLQP